MTSSPEALEALARAYDREDASQRGEPDPWDYDDGNEAERLWRAERIACAQVGLAAYLASSPEGCQEPAVLDVIEEMKWFDSRGGLAIGMHEALRRWIATLSALPAPVAVVAPAVTSFPDIERMLRHFGLSPTSKLRQGSRSDYVDTSDEEDYTEVPDHVLERIRSALIPAKPAVEVVEALNEAIFAELGEPDYKLARWAQGAEPFHYWSRESIENAIHSAALQAPATPDAQTEVEK